eukprot:NODE_15877_length_1024_cov_6.273133.p2 GENE.NODE_15877_length_1024_cov_6.273133~~NODE_15877_length_1024_cov_6.273133.p2  ORF type:complete len:239 (+),score=41.82 NODE_15877_length_1024_cov_6.273133:231-947(+)
MAARAELSLRDRLPASLAAGATAERLAAGIGSEAQGVDNVEPEPARGKLVGGSDTVPLDSSAGHVLVLEALRRSVTSANAGVVCPCQNACSARMEQAGEACCAEEKNDELREVLASPAHASSGSILGWIVRLASLAPKPRGDGGPRIIDSRASGGSSRSMRCTEASEPVPRKRTPRSGSSGAVSFDGSGGKECLSRPGEGIVLVSGAGVEANLAELCGAFVVTAGERSRRRALAAMLL